MVNTNDRNLAGDMKHALDRMMMNALDRMPYLPISSTQLEREVEILRKMLRQRM